MSYFFQIKELILPQRANPIKSIMKKNNNKNKRKENKGKLQEYARNCYIIFSEYGKKIHFT